MSRVVISGSHDAGIPRHVVVRAIKNSGFIITEVGSGLAPEVDTYGKEWAEQNGIPVKPFEAQWHLFGKNAGPVRNGAMAMWLENLILVWDNTTPGSANMRMKTVLWHKPIYEVIWRDGELRYEGHLDKWGGRP